MLAGLEVVRTPLGVAFRAVEEVEGDVVRVFHGYGGLFQGATFGEGVGGFNFVGTLIPHPSLVEPIRKTRDPPCFYFLFSNFLPVYKEGGTSDTSMVVSLKYIPKNPSNWRQLPFL